jgi:hypothetical protein
MYPDGLSATEMLQTLFLKLNSNFVTILVVPFAAPTFN